MHPSTPRPRAARRADGRSRTKGGGQPTDTTERFYCRLERAVIIRLRKRRAAPLDTEPARIGDGRISRSEVVTVDSIVRAEPARFRKTSPLPIDRPLERLIATPRARVSRA
jgi:hypothetical protein